MIKNSALLFAFAALVSCAFTASGIELKKGDHISIVGNALADRMQHSGYLEALIYSSFPSHDLVFRNLGFSGDELNVRLRSEGFGSPDDWLSRAETDVVLAFFGYNESFQGPEGLDGFRSDLARFITSTLSKEYNGEGPPRIVLFSPIAAEKHPDPNFPDADRLNLNVKLYSEAMAEVAREHGVPFVDLYAISWEAYATASEPLTFNGVHLKDSGYAALASAMFEALIGGQAPEAEGADYERLREAVNDKNAVWFSRYRTVDGYNVYGGRSYLEFGGYLNRDTMQREMSMRDVMTANRDRRIWAIARGGDLTVTDDNLPEPVLVETNRSGDGDGGAHVFLSGQEAIALMKVPPGCKVTLFASEEEFPALANPVQMAFDTAGRLWVAVWPNYPERTPQSKTGDRLLVFEDLDGDGKADKSTVFIDDLNAPTGFQFYKDGVILVQAPDVWFVRDTDGDGRADWKERVLNGLDSADSHHTANSLAIDPGGAIYLSDGVFHRTQIETPWGPPVRNRDAAIHRFEPRSSKFEVYISYGFANPHGRVFDYWGNDFVTDATGNNTYFGPAFSGRIDYPAKHSGLRQFWERPSRPSAGTGILSSRHFPPEFQGNFLNINVIGFQGIFRVQADEEGSGLWGRTINPPLVESADPNFRPVAVDVAPDGSIYFLDWHNPIIGHMQHHIRDPSRDHTHGRIYRITYEGRPLLEPKKIAGEPIAALLELLEEPENNVRTRAKIELGARKTEDVIAAAKNWMKQFDPNKIEDQHHLMEALWVHQWHNVVDERLLRQMLRSPEPRARAAAARVLCYWRDRVREPMELFRIAANDPSPRVRLEAVRAASFFRGLEAMELAHEILRYDTDYYLDYTFKETTRQLESTIDEPYFPRESKILESLVARISDVRLLEAPGEEAVLIERLSRPGLNINVRTASLNSLATIHGSDFISEGISALRRLDSREGSASPANDLGFLLASSSKEELGQARQSFSRLIAEAKNESVRRAAYAALVVADGSPGALWSATASDSAARAVLIDSITLQSDIDLRAKFEPLLTAQLQGPEVTDRVRNAAIAALPLMDPDTAGDRFALLAAHLEAGRDIPTASRALIRLPREAWNAESATAAGQAILTWANGVPARDRTDEEFNAVIQSGIELCSFVQSGESSRIQRDLIGLGIPVFVIKSVREQMRYDVTEIVVEAGKDFEIIFVNDDMIPHNVVIVEPGAREEIGKKADKMDPTPDRRGRAYVPRDGRIIAASRMVEPGMRISLKVKAPETPGDYEYVCTYPEHWLVMFGKLVVVEDLDKYLESGSSL